ncbi:hypothetical protein [Helicobacter marmotae]|uniref:Uncharacterized protein n=1 Tax=Helicobacter marmotae TaxID=152490 RepID=A0A3D8I799_9HELI|nr:hypothetical protein [Helicobacter marmotae]RDU61018.1 hypothetical protein CQA63_00480 [Helicobacter marmotae]
MGAINNGTTNKASNAAYISYYALSKQETLSGNKVLLALGGARSKGEELLLSAKDSLRETLETFLTCHSKHCEESLRESLKNPSFWHHEGRRSLTEESLLSTRDSSKESLVANSNSSGLKTKDMTKGQHLLAIQREIL